MSFELTWKTSQTTGRIMAKQIKIGQAAQHDNTGNADDMHDFVTSQCDMNLHFT